MVGHCGILQERRQTGCVLEGCMGGDAPDSSLDHDHVCMHTTLFRSITATLLSYSSVFTTYHQFIYIITTGMAKTVSARVEKAYKIGLEMRTARHPGLRSRSGQWSAFWQH
jgi:hypothetical protein